jgi:hypothetical protein
LNSILEAVLKHAPMIATASNGSSSLRATWCSYCARTDTTAMIVPTPQPRKSGSRFKYPGTLKAGNARSLGILAMARSQCSLSNSEGSPPHTIAWPAVFPQSELVSYSPLLQGLT